MKSLKGHVVKSGLLKSFLISIGLCGIGQGAFGEGDAVRCVPDEVKMCAIFKQGGTSHLMSFERSVIQNYLDACRSDNFDSCVDVGNILPQAVGKDRDLKTAAQVLGKACLAENPNGCFELGQMLWESTDRKDEAFEAMTRSCDLGYRTGCFFRAIPMEAGVGGTPEEAYEIYREFCEDGSSEGCEYQAGLLRRGLGVAQNFERAAEMYEALCDDGAPAACSWLGSMHILGQASLDDPKRVKAVLTYSCERNNANGCGLLGAEMIIANNYEPTEPALRTIAKGCELGSTLSCDLLNDFASSD